MRFHYLPKPAVAILTLFFGLAFIAPAPFTMIAPSKAQPVFPKLLAYKDKSLTKPTSGNFYLLSIAITDPDAFIPGIAYLGGWIKGDAAVIPRSVIFPSTKSFKEVQALNKKDMKKSQNVAATVSLDYVERNFPENFIDKKPRYQDVAFDVRKTGGPSAGLVFALSLIDLLTTEDLLQGRKVAATGTISSGGFIGAIGGVQEKLISVKRAGASLALIPRDNCVDISEIPQGIKVIPVTTLDEAVRVLLGQQVAKTCTNLSP